MKLLVLGGSGMAGHVISIYFKEQGHEVTALTRKRIEYCNNIIGDVTEFGWLKKIVSENEYDGVINAVGILNQDAEENKARSVLINSYLPHFLCDITKKMKTKIIHMSTDCVFSGKTGGYREDSFKDGETFYDRTKALGEVDNSKDLTFRNSVIGPDMNRNGIGLFNWFMKQKGEIDGYTRVIWTGVTTLTLAKAMEKALESRTTGVYNLVNNTTISKFELLRLFNRNFKKNEMLINEVDTLKVDKSLVNSRLDFDFVVPSYEQMIMEMKEWIENHKYLYTHYVYSNDSDE